MATTLSPALLTVVPMAPLVGAILAGLFGKQIGRAGAHTVTILGVVVSFLISAWVLYAVAVDGARFNATIYEWMRVGPLKMEIGFLVDGLTAMMMAVVTFVSLMVHVYTIGYMADDPGYQRFFSYISLFTFSMLMLVMSNNFLQLFFGWEAVGLVSYLLIGFWFTRPTAIYANLKAFLVNRVGDFGFLLGIGFIFSPMSTITMGSVPRELTGSASGIYNTARQVGGVLGSAAVGVLLQARITASLAASTADLSPQVRAGLSSAANVEGGTPPDLAGVPDPVRQQVTDAIHSGLTTAASQTLWLPAAFLLLGAVAAFAMNTSRRPAAAQTEISQPTGS